VTTISGAGFGNIIPTTTLEWFVDTFLNLIGSSLFTFIFVDFVMEFSMKDLQQFFNDNMLDQMLQFAESTSLPESLVFKIRYYYKDLNLKYEDFKIKKQIVEQMPPSI
jgi:UDP-glucose 4-epimerase